MKRSEQISFGRVERSYTDNERAASDTGSVCASRYVFLFPALFSFLASKFSLDKCFSKISKCILCILLIITNFGFGTENF